MNLADLGEDRLIARLLRRFTPGSDLRIGPGDDCAAVGGARARIWQLLKTDCLVESVHFRPEEDRQRVGWKALARSISDIAAMGGEPRHALVTVAVVAEEKVERLDALYAGIKRCADRFGVTLAGGETSRSPGPMFLSIALTGEVERLRCVTRSGGRTGDLLYVTGRLGGSISGRHLDFIPRVTEARWLTNHFKIHAMMDLSDGLGSDLPRLASASGCGFEIDSAALPRTRGTTAEQAIADGEDYELLFAIAPRDGEKLERAWVRQFPKVQLTRIGKLLPFSTPQALPFGHDHFAIR